MEVTERVANPAKYRVHLHIHLDGAIRPSTIWELSRQKNLPLPGNGSLRELEETMKIRSPVDLANYLARFKWICPAVMGDLAAMERVAFEFVEDEAGSAVLYTEPRFSPHLLVGAGGQVTARQVTEAVLRGLARGQQQFGVTARLLLCCVRGFSEYYDDVLEMCTEFWDKGVVGMDISGDEATATTEDGDMHSSEQLLQREIALFQEAARRGIHRTVHSGEAGPAYMVQIALDKMHAERIGHGYHVLEDKELYKRCIKERVHFECCPSSSHLTGSVPLTQTKHPVQRFYEDGVSFSVNVDDPTVIQGNMDSEYSLMRRMGFNEAMFATMNFHAAKACFLPENEKKELLEKICKAFGFPETY
ncbi:adenosine deaminase-like isoform X2 [Amphibalanus amphitrite]|uniref:adenosine deaminase-like isoform X2 n=1 Tax=Amphibalanus amphitrite TaxID=1232801 RepID=UPI001C92794C|nr:adenosine deaminase-like isoform X2 [Amphibalanus amphitrite]